MSEFPIEFRSLSKSYVSGFLSKRQHAVSDLSIKVPRNCIYGFLGANGAGKTTCIKILLGLQFADSGEALLFGQPSTSAEAKSKIGYLPERPYFHDSMDAGSFLHFHRGLFGSLKSKEALPSNDELLSLVGLTGVGTKSLRGYSKGMLQRIGIAQALVNNPELVVLDEPMSGLDPVGRREVRDLIVRLRDLGKTVFFSSHILSDVEDICEHIAFLEKGKLRYEGKLAEIHHPEGASFEVEFQAPKSSGWKPQKIVETAKRKGEIWHLRCLNAEAAKEAAQQIWSEGGQVLSLQRSHRSLEQFLFGDRV